MASKDGQARIRAMVTDKIIEGLERAGSWSKGWATAGCEPHNPFTGTIYRGVNRILLGMAGMGYSSPRWATLKQINEAGGMVKAGEKSTPVVWAGSRAIEKEKSDGTRETVFISCPMRYYQVFNADQTDGVDWPAMPELPGIPDPIQAAEDVIANMPNKPVIDEVMQDRACYHPGLDKIMLPSREQWYSPEAMYQTTFHELVHSTGHEKRLCRHKAGDWSLFMGDESYSFEELVAEIGAAYLCDHVGIFEPIRENTAAYVKSWSRRLRENQDWIIRAAAQADKAADYILGRKHE